MIEIKHITSKDNPKYKTWFKLLEKKYRQREKLFLIEGEVLIKDAIKSGGEIVDVIVSSKEEEPTKTFESIGETIRKEGNLLPYDDPTMYMLKGELFDNLTQTDNGRKVIGVFKLPDRNLLSEIKKRTEEGRSAEGRGTKSKTKLNILILDKIQDPGNMGTLIRTADGAGFSEIIAIKGTVDAFSPKVVRSAAGSIIRVPITYVEGVDELKEMIRSLWQDDRSSDISNDISGELSNDRYSEGIIIATMMNAEENLWDANLSRQVAVIIGNEGAGVSPELMELADVRISIPMQGSIESLNAGVSGALLMYEVFRQQRQ